VAALSGAIEMGTVSTEDLDVAPASRRPRGRTWLLAPVLAVVALIISMVVPSAWQFIFKLPFGAATPAQEKYMAILPFRALGDDPKLRYRAEGVVESLSAKLFQLKNVHLAAAIAVEG